MTRILILGATSAIAEATARCFAAEGARLFLVGRDPQRLEAIAADLRVRGAGAAEVHRMDAADYAAHSQMLSTAVATLGGVDAALIAHGTLSDPKECRDSTERLLAEFHTNALSVAALCRLLAAHFREQGTGTLAVISSVAGDRGRASNYAYGSAKALVSAYCSGLRQELAPLGIRVVTIKPGFVDTPMTAAFRKGPLWASPAAVARRIHRAMRRGEAVVYVPAFWRPIMWLIRAIPERLFVRLRGL